jgi:drug/metabolite transporter (DMT)-like permease
VVSGISLIVYFDFTDMNRALAIKGYLLGAGSSFSLAIILVLTSIIVQHDHPVRVVFYLCLCGLLISLFFIFISVNQIRSFDYASFNITAAFWEGILYTLAVICFLQAFYYVDPIIVSISSYSLDLYSVLFNAVINNEIINTQTSVSTLLIALGSGILIRSEYKKDKKN